MGSFELGCEGVVYHVDAEGNASVASLNPKNDSIFDGYNLWMSRFDFHRVKVQRVHLHSNLLVDSVDSSSTA